MYTPSDLILENYARVLIDFALGSGEGIKKNEVVLLNFDLPALPLGKAVYKRILEKGGNPIVRIHEESFSKTLYETASNEQLEFFPKKYMKSLVDVIDHRMYLIGAEDPFLLKGIDPKKLMLGNKSTQIMKKWLFDKEDRGKMTWTLALYGTQGMAAEAGLSLKGFWEQIEKACFLAEKDPIAVWRSTFKKLEQLRVKLSNMPIDSLHLTAKDTDLTIKLGKDRQWLAGSGRNIPSFEMFTSPDWRGTNGYVFFDHPLYRYGNLIKDVRLEFKNGKVIKADAAKNGNLIQELVKQKNADKVGEYSLTDTRFSHIDAFMANTLYDENYGGKWGNTHLALGSSYHEAYTGNVSKVTSKGWKDLGFNDSPEHTDIIATGDRQVEAIMRDGTKKIIYRKGQFVV